MFGIIRPCRNRLGADLRSAWMAHLCGLCLALRDEHGQLARLVTNYDAVVISALVEAQAGSAGRRRAAGRCALRGMQKASVSTGSGAQLAAAVSLLLASGKIDDHLADGDLDGALRTRAARTVAARWAGAGTRSAAALGLSTAALLDVASRQAAVEHGRGSILTVTAPTEDATAAAFRQTAVVAGRPGNADALAEAGRLFGRLAHLLDAVEDRHPDLERGAWNPITALALAPAQVRALCDDALLGITLALRDVAFVDARLVHVLLVHELRAATERAFRAAGPPSSEPATSPDQPAHPPVAPDDPEWTPPPIGWEAPPPETKRRTPVSGCFGWLLVCGTCQACCAGEYTDPCTGQRREGLCRGGGSDCGGCDCDDCADCGDCCNCCECCDGGCDCS